MRYLAAALLLLVGCAPEPEPPCSDGLVPESEVVGGEPVVCVPEACGTGPWGWLEDDGALHVAPWGHDDADGSRAFPFAGLLAALSAAEEQATPIRVAAGTYEGALALTDLHDGVELEGRCPELVTLDGGSSDDPAVWVQFGEFTLRSVTVTGGDRGIGVAKNGSGSWPHAKLRDVVVTGTKRVGVLATGGGSDVDVRDLVVRDVEAYGPTGHGRGIEISGAARIHGRGVLVGQTVGVGLFAGQVGTQVELDDLTMRDTLDDASGGKTTAIALQDGASFLSVGLRIDGRFDTGLSSIGPGTVEIEDVAILGDGAERGGEGGGGIAVHQGGHLVARELTIDSVRSTGIYVEDTGSSADLASVDIGPILPRLDGSAGHGIDVLGGASLTATDVVVEGARSVGISIAEPDTVASLTDVVVRDTIPVADSPGQAISVFEGASLEGSGIELSGVEDVALLVNSGATAEVSDLYIHDSGDPEVCGTSGVSVQEGARIVLSDARLERICGLGIKVADEGSEGDLDSVAITDVGASGTAELGIAFLSYGGASTVARDLTIERAALSGMLILGEGTHVELDGAAVLDTDPSGLEVAFDDPRARGIELNGGARLVASDLRIERSAGLGLLVVDVGTSVSLQDTQIRGGWNPNPDAVPTGLKVQQGASLVAVGLVIEDNEGIGASVISAGTTVDLSDCVVADTRPTAGGLFGMGMEIIDAEASISDSSFSGNLHLSLLVSSGAVVQLVDVEIVDTLLGHQARGGASLGLQDAAVVEASRLSVHDSAGPGAFVTAGSSLSCSDCTFRDTDFAGLVVLDGELPLQDGSVSASRPGPSIGGGVGILCWHPPELGTGPVLRVEGTHLDGHAGPAVYLRGRGSYSLSGVHITGSAMLPGVPGAVLAMEGVEPWNEATGAGLHLEDVGFSGLPGDAILLDASSGTFEGLVFDDVAGYELRLQHCDGVEPPIDSGLLESNDCAGPLLLLDPPLWFAPAVEVIDVVE